MTRPERDTEREKARAFIARRVQRLRKERRWTQAELSRRLHLSQSRLSEIEGGDGSFTAEQFLTILRLFNVPASEFSATASTEASDLQNALARLGAVHLQERTDVLPDERRSDAGSVLREALVAAESPRFITALAPVLVVNIERINLNLLHLQLTDAGFGRRLGWLVENVLAALRDEVPKASSAADRRRYRRAQVLLESFLAFAAGQLGGHAPAPDVLDAAVRSKQTLDEVLAASSPISRRWGIVTTVQPDDFATALRSARAARS